MVTDEVDRGRAPHALWLAMMIAVALEFVHGHHRHGVRPVQSGEWLDLAPRRSHIPGPRLLGGLLGVAAIALTLHVLSD